MKIIKKGKGRIATLVALIAAAICAVLAVFACVFGGFGASVQTADAYTSSNKSGFTQVFNNIDIYNSSTRKFKRDGLTDFIKQLSGATDKDGFEKFYMENRDALFDQFLSSRIKSQNPTNKDLLVNVGGFEWTPVYMSKTNDGEIFVTLWLADSYGIVRFGPRSDLTTTNLFYTDSDVRDYCTTNSNSPFVALGNILDEYILVQKPVKNYAAQAFVAQDTTTVDYAKDKIWIPSVLAIGAIEYAPDPYTDVWKCSTAQKSSNSDYWVQQSSKNSNGYLGYWESYSSSISNLSLAENSGIHTMTSKGVRPAFHLNLTKALNNMEDSEAVTPSATPKVTYTGNLYTSSKLPEITVENAYTSGAIAWTDTKLTEGTNEYNWKFTPTNPDYQAVTGTYTLTVLPVRFESIEYDFDPGTTVIYTDTPLSAIKDCLTVTARNNDGSYYGGGDGLLASGDYGLYGTLSAGTNTLMLIYGGKTFDIRITGVINADTVSCEGLEISVLPKVLTYKSYEKFNVTGMKVNAVYSNGSKVEVTDYEIEYPDYDGDTSDCFHYGDALITVKYGADGAEYTATVEVTVTKAASEVTPDVTVSGTLYTSSSLPLIATSAGDTAGVIEWDKVEDGDGNRKLPPLVAGNNGYGWTFKPADTNLEEVTGVYYLTVEEVKLSKIEVTYDPEVLTDPETDEPVLDVGGLPVIKKIYTSFDINGLKTVTVKGYNNDGSLYKQFDDNGVIPVGEYALSGVLVAGDSVITVTFGGKVATFTVEGVIETEIEGIKASYPSTANSTGVMTVYASYSEEKLKENLTVTVLYNDGAERELSRSDYYDLENHLSEDDPYIKIIYGDKEYVYKNIHNLGSARFDRIEVEFKPENNLIYETIDPDKINLLKKFFTVKKIMTDGEVIVLSDAEYRLTGTLSAADESNELTVSYTPAGSPNTVTVTVEIPEVEADRLLSIELAEYNRPEGGLTTGTPLTALLDKENGVSAFKIRAVYATAVKTVSRLETLTLTGELKAGKNCYLVITYSDGVYEASLRVNVGEVTLVKKKPVVSPKINMAGAVLVDGEKLPAISLSSGDTVGTIFWEKIDDGEGNKVDVKLKTGSYDYKWKFVPDEEVADIYEGAEGVYPITAAARRVVSLEIELRTGATVYPTTSASDLKERFIVNAVYNYTDGDGTIHKEKGVDPAAYEIYFNLVANEDCTVNFRYTDKNGYFALGEKKIRVEQPGSTVSVETRWDEETMKTVFNGKAQKPTAYFTITQDGQEVKIVLEVAVYKVVGGVETAASAIDRGVYRVKAVAPASGKYALVGQTIRDFEITAQKITRPTALSTGYVYTGAEQEFLFNGFNPDIMSVEGNRQTEAGKHEVTVTLTDKNYEFEGVTGETLSFVFDIVPESASVTPAPTPTVTVEGNGISTGLAIAIGVAALLVFIIALVAIIVALKNRPSSDSDGFYDDVSSDNLK